MRLALHMMARLALIGVAAAYLGAQLYVTTTLNRFLRPANWQTWWGELDDWLIAPVPLVGVWLLMVAARRGGGRWRWRWCIGALLSSGLFWHLGQGIYTAITMPDIIKFVAFFMSPHLVLLAALGPMWVLSSAFGSKCS